MFRRPEQTPQHKLLLSFNAHDPSKFHKVSRSSLPNHHPQDTKSVAGLANMTYNHVVELQFAYRAAQDRAAGLTGGAGGGEAGTAGTAGNAAAAEDKAASAEASEGGIEAGGAAEAAVGEKKGAEVGGAGAEPKEGSAEDAAAKAKAEAEAEAKLLEKGAAVEEFMNATASQLTYYGLLQLHQHLKDRQLCVFFRNNHFSTMFKFEVPYPIMPYRALSCPIVPCRTLHVAYPSVRYRALLCPILPHPTLPYCDLPVRTLPYPTYPILRLGEALPARNGPRLFGRAIGGVGAAGRGRWRHRVRE